MNTIKVSTRPFLYTFLIELRSKERPSIKFEFECLAENEDIAVKQALNAHPDAEVIEVF